ncbi:MAG: hypothetical protein IH934_04765 [Nanoarchaeota archaeon]|nr:hypothetical protein [Nanoarchaeota archaeon]
MNKTLILILGILTILFIPGCVDNTSAIRHCESLGLQYTGKVLTCNIQCINITSGQLFTYNGDCKFIGR